MVWNIPLLPLLTRPGSVPSQPLVQSPASSLAAVLVCVWMLTTNHKSNPNKLPIP